MSDSTSDEARRERLRNHLKWMTGDRLVDLEVAFIDAGFKQIEANHAAFIRSRMEPEGEGEREPDPEPTMLVVSPYGQIRWEGEPTQPDDIVFDKSRGYVGQATARIEPGEMNTWAQKIKPLNPQKWKPEDLAWFKLKPEREGEKSKTAPDHIEWFDDHKAFKARIYADRAAALNKLQAEGQKWDAGCISADRVKPAEIVDATPEPAWKRAKVGDHIQTNAGNVFQLVEKECGGVWAIYRTNGEFGHINETDIASILPTPLRHGDFGSRPEEDGA